MKRNTYSKKSYKDVSGTFDFTATSPTVALLGKLPISNKASIGINDKGIWLWHIDSSESISLRLFPANCQLGFFEWSWIREIQVSYSRKMAFFVFNDMDSLLDKVLLCEVTADFRNTFLTTVGDHPALQFPLTSPRHFSAFDYVASHHYTQVYIIE